MKRKKIKTRPWDVVEHLKTDEDMAAYLDAVLEEGDPANLFAIPRTRRNALTTVAFCKSP